MAVPAAEVRGLESPPGGVHTPVEGKMDAHTAPRRNYGWEVACSAASSHRAVAAGNRAAGSALGMEVHTAAGTVAAHKGPSAPAACGT